MGGASAANGSWDGAKEPGHMWLAHAGRAAGMAATGAHHVHLAVRLLAAGLTPAASFSPTAGKLPGGAVLQTLVDGLGGWALVLSLAGLVIGAALWAVGAHSQNYQQSFVGKRAVLVSGFAALIVGAAPAIIDFFFHTGLHVTNPLAQ